MTFPNDQLSLECKTAELTLELFDKEDLPTKKKTLGFGILACIFLPSRKKTWAFKRIPGCGIFFSKFGGLNTAWCFKWEMTSKRSQAAFEVCIWLIKSLSIYTFGFNSNLIFCLVWQHVTKPPFSKGQAVSFRELIGIRSHETINLMTRQDLEQSVQVRCQHHLERRDFWREQMCRFFVTVFVYTPKE